MYGRVADWMEVNPLYSKKNIVLAHTINGYNSLGEFRLSNAAKIDVMESMLCLIVILLEF